MPGARSTDIETMAKEQTWHITVDGAEHTVTYVRPGLRSGGAALYVDGGEGRLIRPRDGYLDEPIHVGGKECRFVLREYLPDVAVDGVFLDSGKPYAPIAPLPTWCRVLTALPILACFVLIRNLPISIVAAFIAWRGSERIAQRSGVAAEKKLRQCLAVLTVIWVLAVVLRLSGLLGG